MSGITDCATTKDRVQHWDTVLDEYESKIGLPTYNSPGSSDELQGYLSMDRNVIEKLSPDDCIGISIRLSQFAFHIQRSYNREIARINWAKSEISKTVATQLGNYDKYAKYEERMQLSIKDNDAASKLNQISIYAQQRADRLEFMATNLNNLSNILREAQRVRSKHVNG